MLVRIFDRVTPEGRDAHGSAQSMADRRAETIAWLQREVTRKGVVRPHKIGHGDIAVDLRRVFFRSRVSRREQTWH